MSLRITLFLFIFSTVMTVSAQENIPISALIFERIEINIGEVYEEDPPQIIKFPFRNTASAPLLIENIISSCGCTVADWNRKPIKSGESSVIDIVFNPSGMYGDLEKYIKIKANLSDAPFIELKITGYINSRFMEKPTYYPGQYGYLIISDYRFNFNEIAGNQTRVLSTPLYNDGNDSIRIYGFEDLPSFLKVESHPIVIGPKDTGRLVVQYIPNESLKPGVYKGNAKVNTNDRFFAQKSLSYYIDITYPNNQTKKQLRRSPKAYVENSVVDFGTISAGAVVQGSVVIENKGKEPLIILNHQSDCSCALPVYPDAIPAGGSAVIPVRFDAVFKSGQQNKVITLYTNDPKQPKIQLLVKAFVR